MITQRHYFSDADTVAQRLAQDVAASLRQALSSKEQAVLAVSGGSTPVKFFEKLSQLPLAWRQVSITLVDERQVPATDERSNARLVRQSLLQNKAAPAQFIPLFQNPAAALVPDFDVAVLGMGNDGHTASFFPGGDTLALALSPAAPILVPLSAPGSGEPRLTFSLPKILAAKEIFLLIEGPDKRHTLEQAQSGCDIYEMPVRSLLHSNKPIEIYWCP